MGGSGLKLEKICLTHIDKGGSVADFLGALFYPSARNASFRNASFRFLEKFEQVFVVLCDLHFPHAEPLVKIVSNNFKLTHDGWANWGYEPLALLDRAIKHFKNISRKICCSHCFLHKHADFFNTKNNSMSQNSSLKSYTHRQGGVLWQIFWGLYFTRRRSIASRRVK